MKLLLLPIAAILSSMVAAIPVPRGTTGAVISLASGNDLRIYHQEAEFPGAIFEISVQNPTATPTGDGLIYRGPVRKNTPLAAVYWLDGDDNYQIRVYFITERNTLGEVGANNKGWNNGIDIGFPVAPDSSLLYATRSGSTVIVGYTNSDGNLSEAYFDGTWKTYTL